MTAQLRYALALIGYERRHAATTWALRLGRWAATVTLWGITTGATLFGLLWAWVFIVWVVR
jgi:hypothetical protein